MQPGFSLREMTPQDGPAIAALSDQSSDGGAIGFHNLYHHDSFTTIMALHEDACGVVAEAPGHEGIVGMGMMSLGACQYEGELRPFAYLFSLSVHPGYRRRGIARELASWRIQAARERLGPQVVVYAGIQGGNEGSLRAASTWSSQIIASRALTPVVKMLSAAPARPANLAGVEVRPADAKDYEAIARRQNEFYAGYSLYPPRTADRIAGWHGLAPFGEPIRGCYVAADRQGNLLAGLSVTEEGRLVTTEITRMSRPYQAANALLHFFPADGQVRRLHVKDLWFAPGQVEAAAYLWERLRWDLRERGTMMMAFLDRRSPLTKAIRLPWYMPKPGGYLALLADRPASQEQLLYFIV